jgi:spermidine synthase
MSVWFDEMLHAGIGQRLAVERIIFRQHTEHQDLVIFENPDFGRVLALDGVVQTTEGDEFIYHEMMAHVPILAHGAAHRVLIIGGGDGGMARETLRHPGVEHATMVEIDRSVVEMSRTHLPSLSNGAFDDARLDLVIADGAKFVAETDRRFDVIIVDSTDPIGPGSVLFENSFYLSCKRCLNPGGVMVTQNGVPFVQGDEVTNTHTRLKDDFADVAFYSATIPTYQGGEMAFGWATDNVELRRLPAEVLAARHDAAKLSTRYYTPELHVGSFALPAYIRALFS